MTFSKGGRMLKDNFKFFVGEDELEHVKQYKYLGVNISNTAKFSVAEKTLGLKASRALFSIKQGLFDKNIKPSSMLSLFEALVKPIALYGSDIWAAYKPSYKNKTLDDMFEQSLKSNSEFDKVFIKFCKYVLGVQSKACNFAVFSELGQFPLLISILTSCINFWLHTTQSKSDSLISKAYWEQFSSSNDKGTWVQFIKRILYELGFSHVWNTNCTFDSDALLAAIKRKLKERFMSFWKNRFSGDEGMKKLQTYKLLKQNFGFEPYLDCLHDKNIRKCLTAFRISAHRLRIERGRYCGETPEQRLCIRCNTIEDEVHFLCHCKKYEVARLQLFETIKTTHFTTRSDHTDVFLGLMKSEDISVIKAVAKFIQECEII